MWCYLVTINIPPPWTHTTNTLTSTCPFCMSVFVVCVGGGGVGWWEVEGRCWLSLNNTTCGNMYTNHSYHDHLLLMLHICQPVLATKCNKVTCVLCFWSCSHASHISWHITFFTPHFMTHLFNCYISRLAPHLVIRLILSRTCSLYYGTFRTFDDKCHSMHCVWWHYATRLMAHWFIL